MAKIRSQNIIVKLVKIAKKLKIDKIAKNEISWFSQFCFKLFYFQFLPIFFQAILQFYVIWFTIDTGNRELAKQLDCMTKTWILVGLSILKFSLDSAQNVRAFPIDEVKIFDRGQITEFLDYYTEKKIAGKLPIGILYYATSITSRCILIAIAVYYLPIYLLSILGIVHLTLMALPCFVIGSYCKSFFEEARRKLKGKKRKILWKLFYYFVVGTSRDFFIFFRFLESIYLFFKCFK